MKYLLMILLGFSAKVTRNTHTALIVEIMRANYLYDKRGGVYATTK